ncbi:HD-GYP domain-containing protein [Pararhodospirillum photometricum]|uniref:Response regulator receiver:Metal-dependent phosphohydrolase, HD subdomain n=1 Tax=Pararhodospirillum photometricum DSM 122 TaxID=1150469 RepID=H6SPC3_PARPM|nr:HD domain-containing phosphohydrolase [Pararhodospirillum photometricum]CCG09448.1 Response regulator receiver:Metal-dependent phosphohydrolase, HD subdomain [Pararhodospirillum photometricum DSM 122]
MRVLLLDDDETNLIIYKSIAQRTGQEIEIVCETDPLVALEACRARMPDLIVLDYLMPGMDGLEFLSRVRRHPEGRDVPIVMITAAGERSVRHQALERGATDFLAKPVDATEMRVRLTNLLALRRSHLRQVDWNHHLAHEVDLATRKISNREHELIIRLTRAAEFRDPETGGHIQRMASYSHLIARHLGLPEGFCDLILRASPMHDVGKLGVPDAILLKPGRLTADEFTVMKNHTTIGHAILSGSESDLIQLGAEIALTHHEKVDGTGYPYGVSGEALSLPGRIVAVADVFDALTNERPYKRAWRLDQARQFLVEGRGSHFDPLCVDAFLAAWDEVLVIKARFVDEALVPDELDLLQTLS